MRRGCDSDFRSSVLVVEGDVTSRRAMASALAGAGYEVTAAADAGEAEGLLARRAFACAVTGLPLSGDGTGLRVVSAACASGVPVLAVSAGGSLDEAVAAVKAGAEDVLARPFDPADLADRVARAIRLYPDGSMAHRGNPSRSRRCRGTAGPLPPARGVTGKQPAPDWGDIVAGVVAVSPAMRRILHLVHTVARSRATVLILGESGTGKERVARAIHALSDRAAGPFVAVNCAAIPEALLESELFGHEKGAFSGADRTHRGRFEQAVGGTLLLDEISEMPLGLQAKLLRVLQEFEVDRVGGHGPVPVDVRVIASTNRDLRAMVARGQFREDLYYRIHVFPLRIPPLRERPEDILPLVRHFLAHLGGAVTGITPAAARALLAHPWPGNVRELRNVVERGALLCQGNLLDVADLLLDAPPWSGGSLVPAGFPAPVAPVSPLAPEHPLATPSPRFPASPARRAGEGAQPGRSLGTFRSLTLPAPQGAFTDPWAVGGDGAEGDDGGYEDGEGVARSLLVGGGSVAEGTVWPHGSAARPAGPARAVPDAVTGIAAVPAAAATPSLAEVERAVILNTLQENGGNRTRTARCLGISLRTLRNRLRDYREAGIQVPAPAEGITAARSLSCA